MNTNFYELDEAEMFDVEGGNPVVVYAILAIGKYAVVPAAKIVGEAIVAGLITKAVGDLIK